LHEETLPNDCLPIIDRTDEDSDLLKIIAYILVDRGLELTDYNWHWSNSPGYRDRVIIPFYHEGRIVGWTGRKITDGKPRYLTTAQPGYVFNMDAQTSDRKYAIVVEGQFDAIAIGGVAIMHNEPNEIQCARINSLFRDIIVVPDKDRAGAKMIIAALNNGWSISMPPWGEEIKDVSDAVKKYGKVYTLAAILHYKEDNKIKIEIQKKKLENINDKQN
jgi:DNA primase